MRQGRLGRSLGPDVRGHQVKIEEIKQLQSYMRRLFGNETIRVKALARKEDSAEVFVGEEFIGIMYRDDEDDELSFNFSMAILGSDLKS